MFRIVALIFIISFYGCGSYKQVPYFQDLNRNSLEGDKIGVIPVPVIKNGDRLDITVTSLNPEASAVFNSANHSTLSVTEELGSGIGYVIDETGKVKLPYVGSVKLAGLNISEIQNTLATELQKFLKEPIVKVRLLNFKISILGDVLRPDVYTFNEYPVSIMQALSKAGDLNITAKRSNVLIIREEDGSRKYISIDLRSKRVLSSPQYFLRSNDVVYVQPGKTKMSTNDRGYRTGSLILSALSIVAIVIANL